MKKTLMIAPYFLLWCLYFLMTLKQRGEYLKSLEKGYKCVDSYDSSQFVPGSYMTYHYDRSRKPERDYDTWKEFWSKRGYGKNQVKA